MLEGLGKGITVGDVSFSNNEDMVHYIASELHEMYWTGRSQELRDVYDTWRFFPSNWEERRHVLWCDNARSLLKRFKCEDIIAILDYVKNNIDVGKERERRVNAIVESRTSDFRSLGSKFKDIAERQKFIATKLHEICWEYNESLQVEQDPWIYHENDWEEDTHKYWLEEANYVLSKGEFDDVVTLLEYFRSSNMRPLEVKNKKSNVLTIRLFGNAGQVDIWDTEAYRFAIEERKDFEESLNVKNKELYSDADNLGDWAVCIYGKGISFGFRKSKVLHIVKTEEEAILFVGRWVAQISKGYLVIDLD